MTELTGFLPTLALCAMSIAHSLRPKLLIFAAPGTAQFLCLIGHPHPALGQCLVGDGAYALWRPVPIGVPT